MEVLPENMTEQALTFHEMNLAMPATFRPVERLRSVLYEENYPFLLRRLSAFSTFATSYDQLMDLLAGISGRERVIEDRCASLCKRLALETRCYHIQRRFQPLGELYQPLKAEDIDKEFVEGLFEGDAIDILLPDVPLVLIGHDDFGCNVLATPGDSQAFEWLKVRAASTGLFLLEPPRS